MSLLESRRITRPKEQVRQGDYPNTWPPNERWDEIPRLYDAGADYAGATRSKRLPLLEWIIRLADLPRLHRYRLTWV